MKNWQKHIAESKELIRIEKQGENKMFDEETNKIKEKAAAWAKSQSTEKLVSIKKNSGQIRGDNFEEVSQIEWTIHAINNELDRRLQEEVLKTKEEIISIFKSVPKRKKS